MERSKRSKAESTSHIRKSLGLHSSLLYGLNDTFRQHHVSYGSMVETVLCAGVVSRVSSVLQRDVKQFGKQFLFDRKEETCWNSDQGSSQWITLELPHKVCISEIHIQFQGGFSSRSCILEGCLKECELEKIAEFYPEDNNALQLNLCDAQI
ncbi:hypothetical protein GDO81_001355 [Engystomops pustulosus]|uniref:Nuclear receptor 2C2-associated protein n=1 Tax=Engystomops pustulosus TaxID=76066 RepID=A0AAV7DBV9_ENGPU|nr:hypothetical protein GDO81_001355 [Engystomops pustulosus]KAG8594904.1 hypothetical protein GDO81_001355 [Engystomops pustulosus]